MSFISLSFLGFFAGLLLLYYTVSQKNQWIVLLAASYYFYLFADGRLIVFMLSTTVSTYLCALHMDNINKRYQKYEQIVKEGNNREARKKIQEHAGKEKRKTLLLVLLLNFGILFLLKYFHVFKGMEKFSLLLPLGISFYTFQSVGYLVDVYRNKYSAERNLVKYALFVSYFPQIVQGPISRYDELSSQLFEGRPFQYQNVKYGIQLMVWGYMKKLIIANRMAVMTTAIWGNTDRYQGFYIVAASLLSYLELYADFSGGIDIARGASQAMGIVLPDNFKRPFFADSLAEFWRRWHMSLNNWWRDYIFYPLTLSKRLTGLGRNSRKIFGDYVGKRVPTIIALFIVRIVNGLWHGAKASYLLGGLYHGILISASFLLENKLAALNKKLNIKTECFSFRLFRIIRTYVIISIPRAISHASNLSQAMVNIKNMFARFNPWIFFDGSFYQLGVGRKEFQMVIFFCFILLGVSILQEKGISIRKKLEEQNVAARWLIYMASIFSIILFGVYGMGYDAAGFQYMNF